MNRPFLASALLVVLAASGLADSGVPYVGQIVFAAPTEASILVVPDGSGPALDSARLQGGSTVDATIRVQLVVPFTRRSILKTSSPVLLSCQLKSI